MTDAIAQAMAMKALSTASGKADLENGKVPSAQLPIATQEADPETGEMRTVFVYDEAKMPRQEYVNYLSGKTQADVEYLYMMGGYDYE